MSLDNISGPRDTVKPEQFLVLPGALDLSRGFRTGGEDFDNSITAILEKGRWDVLLSVAAYGLYIDCDIQEALSIDFSEPEAALVLAEAANRAAKTHSGAYYRLKAPLVAAAIAQGCIYWSREDENGVPIYYVLGPRTGVASFHDPFGEVRECIEKLGRGRHYEEQGNWSGIIRQDHAFEILRDFIAMQQGRSGHLATYYRHATKPRQDTIDGQYWITVGQDGLVRVHPMRGDLASYNETPDGKLDWLSRKRMTEKEYAERAKDKDIQSFLTEFITSPEALERQPSEHARIELARRRNDIIDLVLSCEGPWDPIHRHPDSVISNVVWNTDKEALEVMFKSDRYPSKPSDSEFFYPAEGETRKIST